jgi:hypothetical protein
LNGTQAVAEACKQLINYVAIHPNAGICYKACNMIFSIHTNVSYLSELSGKNHASAYLYLKNHDDETFNNGTILTMLSIIKHVMSSASESELAALYYSCKDVVPICTTLEEMGHPQLKCTMITTNNITVQAPWAPRHLKLPNLWINISIGSNAAMHNVNSSISGIVALTTVQTMHQTSSHKTYQAVYKFTSRTPFHVNENHPTISSCFQTSHLS